MIYAFDERFPMIKLVPPPFGDGTVFTFEKYYSYSGYLSVSDFTIA